MKAIQLHPAVPGLWIYAAVWEAEHNSNVTAARALMQQGLRACPKSETLWLEYFRMELIFAEKVKARRLVLGISTPRTPEITEVGEVDDNDTSKEGIDGDEEKGKATVSHFTASCKIAQVIYRKAISEIPDSLEFRQRFLEILESIDVEKLMVLEGEIYAGLREHFVTDEDSWSWLARRQFVKAESKGMDIVECRKEATKVYHAILDLLPVCLLHAIFTSLAQ
jgi:U3 small nucleolar RNA-associated protein 6